MTRTDARERFLAARVARLATAGADGAPHLVPVVFAVDGEVIYFAVDHKPKSGARLRRIDNIVDNPQVCLLVDVYSDDWSQLWWARADGAARLVEVAQEQPALDLLVRRYEQYREQRPGGPVVAVDVTRWSGWSGAG